MGAFDYHHYYLNPSLKSAIQYEKFLVPFFPQKGIKFTQIVSFTLGSNAGFSISFNDWM